MAPTTPPTTSTPAIAHRRQRLHAEPPTPPAPNPFPCTVGMLATAETAADTGTDPAGGLVRVPPAAGRTEPTEPDPAPAISTADHDAAGIGPPENLGIRFRSAARSRI